MSTVPIATLTELVADETLGLKSLASSVGSVKADPSQYDHFDQNAVDGLQNLSEQTLNMIAVTEEGKTTPNGKSRKKKLVYFDSPYKKGEVGAALPMSLTPMGTLSDPCTNKIPDFRWTDLLKILKKKGEPVNVQKLMNGNVFRKWRAQGLYIDTIKNLCVELESVGFFKRVQGDSSRNPYWVTGSDFKWDLQAYLASIQGSYDGKAEDSEDNIPTEVVETQPVDVGDSQQQPQQAVTDTFSPRPKRLSEEPSTVSRPKKRRRQASDAEVVTKMRDKDNVLKYCVRIRGEELWLDVAEICDHKDAGSIFDKVKDFESKQIGDDLKAVDSIEDRVVANTYNKTLNFVVKWQNGETTLEPYSKVASLPAVHTLLFNEIANLREEVEILKQKSAANELEIQHKDQMLQQIAQSVSQTTLMEGQVKP